MAVTHTIIPHMRGRGEGVIVNVTSSVCFAAMPLVAAYAASKFAVEGFSEALVHELRTVGVRVKLVEPGYGPGTSFMANSAADERAHSAGLPCLCASLMESMQNPGLVTTATQVADAVFAAATDETDQLRFPAGPDSEHLAQARWRTSDEEFLAGMRSRFRMKEVTG